MVLLSIFGMIRGFHKLRLSVCQTLVNISKINSSLEVADFVMNEVWDADKFCVIFREELVLRICWFDISYMSYDDFLFWKPYPNWTIFTKSTYYFLLPNLCSLVGMGEWWHCLWKLSLLPHIKVLFYWKFSQDRVWRVFCLICAAMTESLKYYFLLWQFSNSFSASIEMKA